MEEKPWRILEFYSGIGGMRYSLMRASVRGEMVEAFDINDLANDVYEFNFGHRPYQGNIQSITAKDLDDYRAHAWLLSPPCQPYTRQGLQKHSADARASSFVKVLDLIPNMQQPPLFLFVENVVGFEKSDTHELMMDILAKTGFTTQEYILSPLQFGIPYSRPRYFCLAKRKSVFFKNSSYNNLLTSTPAPLMTQEEANLLHLRMSLDENQEAIDVTCDLIRNFLEPDLSYIKQEYPPEIQCESNVPNWNLKITCSQGTDHAPQKDGHTYFSNNENEKEFHGSGDISMDKYMVPWSLIERWGSAMDIVYPDSRRCCCFTKSYYRYVKGTGSLLATSETSSVKFNKSSETSLKELGLRYFTPREVANLHSFPEDFNFPLHVSLRQRYALLGNSLSIAVVAPLLRYLFAEPQNC